MAKTTTSTQIRTLYSDGVSCMNIKFYNTNLSFQLNPFTGKDQNGLSRYDMKAGQQTTVNYEGAYALYKAAMDIIDEKLQQTFLSVPCNGASLILERKMGMNGQPETVFSISKNNVTIPFKFNTIEQQVNINGQPQTRQMQSGLGSFAMTIEGYLTGINADRHLDKLTEDFAKLQNSQNSQDQQQNRFNKPYKKFNRFNNNNYQNNPQPAPVQPIQQQPQQQLQQYQQQSFSDYQLN